MSRLRANEVLDKAGFGPFLASEGMNVPVGKDITYVNGVTTFDEEILTTRTINVNRINISDNAGTNNVWTEGRLGLEDDASLYFGDSDDLRLHHDGTAGVSNITADLLVLRAKTGLGDPYISCTQGGSVQLRYSGTPRFETTADGVSISGNVASTYLTADSSGVAITGSTSSTGGWAGTTSSANVLGGIVMPFTCGINGRVGLPPVQTTLIFGGSEYSAGDNHEGVTMPHAGKLYAVTLHAEDAIGNLTLSAVVNGTANTSYQIAFTSPTVSDPSPIETFYSSPLTFAAGDRINFEVTTTTLSQMQVLTLTFFVKFD